MSGTTQNCHVLADFSIIPMGAGTNTTKYIVECQKVLLDSGLNFNLHANGTNLEGNYDQTRTDKSVTMQDSIRVVNDKIAAETNANV
ncbi:unnamed protein product [Rhizophagus irregularis]|nr:unnamed protein product [Rhizophagus irregularis]